MQIHRLVPVTENELIGRCLPHKAQSPTTPSISSSGSPRLENFKRYPERSLPSSGSASHNYWPAAWGCSRSYAPRPPHDACSVSGLCIQSGRPTGTRFVNYGDPAISIRGCLHDDPGVLPWTDRRPQREKSNLKLLRKRRWRKDCSNREGECQDENRFLPHYPSTLTGPTVTCWFGEACSQARCDSSLSQRRPRSTRGRLGRRRTLRCGPRANRQLGYHHEQTRNFFLPESYYL